MNCLGLSTAKLIPFSTQLANFKSEVLPNNRLLIQAIEWKDLFIKRNTFPVNDHKKSIVYGILLLRKNWNFATICLFII